MVWRNSGFSCDPLFRHGLKITEQTHRDNIRDIAAVAIVVDLRRRFSCRRGAGRYRLAGNREIGRLYTLRIDADYKPSVELEGRDAREAISIMNTVFESF